MRVSHEVPIELLEKSKTFNDYDYILYHLLDKYPDYLNFFKENSTRYKILDNSAYEFFVSGQKFDIEKYIYYINLIQPNEFLLPDFLMDKEKTINSFDEWFKKYDSKITTGIKRIATVQGKTFDEWMDCYNFYLKNINYINKFAISFGYDWLENFHPNTENYPNKSIKRAVGRQYLLHYLNDNNLIIKDKPYHLLGSYWYKEFHTYKIMKYDWIKTIDTSIPIKFGILEKNMDDEKPNIILDDFVDKSLETKQIQQIMKNILEFKKWIK